MRAKKRARKPSGKTLAQRLAESMRKEPPLPKRVWVDFELTEFGWHVYQCHPFQPLMLVMKKGATYRGAWFDMGKK